MQWVVFCSLFLSVFSISLSSQLSRNKKKQKHVCFYYDVVVVVLVVDDVHHKSVYDLFLSGSLLYLPSERRVHPPFTMRLTTRNWRLKTKHIKTFYIEIWEAWLGVVWENFADDRRQNDAEFMQ